ncbi:MAG: hypothetical protein ACYCSR_11160 [Thiomonas sp.]
MSRPPLPRLRTLIRQQASLTTIVLMAWTYALLPTLQALAFPQRWVEVPYCAGQLGSFQAAPNAQAQAPHTETPHQPPQHLLIQLGHDQTALLDQPALLPGAQRIAPSPQGEFRFARQQERAPRVETRFLRPPSHAPPWAPVLTL